MYDICINSWTKHTNDTKGTFKIHRFEAVKAMAKIIILVKFEQIYQILQKKRIKLLITILSDAEDDMKDKKAAKDTRRTPKSTDRKINWQPDPAPL